MNILLIIERIAAEIPHSSPLNSVPVVKSNHSLSAEEDFMLERPGCSDSAMHASLASTCPVTGQYLYEHSTNLKSSKNRT